MKRTAGFVASLCALLFLALTSTLQAETLTASVIMTPGAEITPPVPPPAAATGGAIVTINITRGAGGAITAATMNFRGSFSFPASVSVIGFHIHEGAANANGPIIWDLAVNTGSAIFFNGGSGFIDLNVPNVNLARLPDLLANPSRFYVNLHTRDNPAGAIRGQITKFVETLGNTVPMNTAQEVNPPAPLPAGATGVGTYTINPVRNTVTGEITGGSFRFTVTPNIPAGSVVRGLHIHEAVAGVNGPIVLDSGLSGTNSITLTTGTETITAASVVTSTSLEPFKRFINNPVGFYMNLHTSANPAGVIRGQMTSLTSPPVIEFTPTTFLTTDSASANVNLFLSGANFATTFLANGQTVSSGIDEVTAFYGVTIPGSLRGNAGVIYVQAKNSDGLLSAPRAIVVAPQNKVNAIAATTVDGAKFGPIVSPESIASAFGTLLASQNANATALPLPTSLDGTSVYVNGAAAGLFFVSGGQINYLIPPGTLIGPGQVVVLAKDGTVSRGAANVAITIPAILTRKADGTGAPAAVASADGQNFNIPVSNPDGTPNPIDAGNFVALFGTGMRFVSTAITNSITIGGTNITPLFVGPQGQLEGVDQVNLQIPQSLAGRGEVDLIITLDGKPTNLVKLRIK